MRKARQQDDAQRRPGFRARVARNAGRMVGANEVRSGVEAGKEAYQYAFQDERATQEETFVEAVRRQQLTEDDILGAATRQRVIALINGGLGVVIGLSAIYSLLMGLGSFSRMTWGISALFIAGLLLVLGLRGSFRLWQIRERRLGSFEEFLSKRHEWWPRPAQRREAGTGLAVRGGTEPAQRRSGR